MDLSRWSGARQCSLHREAVEGQSGAGCGAPRQRQGVRPSLNRPRRRASGWSRWSAAVTNRRFSLAAPRGGASPNDARDAPRQACASGGRAAPASSGSKSLSGLQATPNATSPVRIAIIRYHSGICGSEPSRLGAGS